MSPILSKFFHGLLSPCVKRLLVGLECCKALLAPSALQPRCSSLPPVSPSSPFLVVTPPPPLSFTATGKTVCCSAVKSKVHSFQSISKALLNPCRH